ncbi:lon protease Lon [Candidatus Magnetomorum sp. HK-1]|nr:lon protease Lon [Candidatus Magnetomorum sp. HK-1]
MNDLISQDIIQDAENIDHNTISKSLPLLPVRDVVLFTNMLLPIFVGQDKTISAVEKAVQKFKQFLFIVTQKNIDQEKPGKDDIFKVGTIAKILQRIKLPDGRIKIVIQGIAQGKWSQIYKRYGCNMVKYELLPDEKEKEDKNATLEIQALMRNVCDNSAEILTLHGEYSDDAASILDSIQSPGKLADLVAANLQLQIKDAQELLEITHPIDRLKAVNRLLAKEVELSAVQARIQNDVEDEINKTQRDYYLREHLRAIYKELGENDEFSLEIEEYEKKIKKKHLSKEALKEAKKQVKRLDQMQYDAAEAAIVRTYLDCILELPWNKYSKEMLDIPYAKKVLDSGHFGLEKVKDRILEYLSVRKLNPKMKGPILCFVGPPGVGKTSLGKAIARAMKRKFVRLSLGGIRDEAEIRGHRRTYIGAMPGRVISGIRQCNTMNPVFMMDEVDKLGADFRGDPSSALLEVLDPEQNASFSDHYLNIPFDLSKVMFIMTANMNDEIPSALLDRMEQIELPGYTEDEKQLIARNYLIPRQQKESGLSRRKITISDGALLLMIKEYTYEAGVRNLEREISMVFRKIARKIAENKSGHFKVSRQNLHKYLGPPKYLPEFEQEESEIGITTGLAWTQAGGEPLYVEATAVYGKGEIQLTGQLGDIMQESAKAALTFARSNYKRFKTKRSFFEHHDIHIHVPSGAVPKDGPSAGIAIAISIISLLTQRPVKKDVAMTGEISLRGRILPIGGLKEKAIGALRAGIKTIIIPKKNEKDMVDIPINARKKLKFVLVSHMDEIIDVALKAPKIIPQKKVSKAKGRVSKK